MITYVKNAQNINAEICLDKFYLKIWLFCKIIFHRIVSYQKTEGRINIQIL